MERIMIIGCGGSGKSTLARALGEKTGLPVVHLDQIWWSPGNWQHLEQEEFDMRLAEAVEEPRWIIDGNFNRTMQMRLERCDTVIYLDFPAVVCLLGWIKRVVTNWGKARPDMAEGCSEWFDPEFAGWILRFNRTYRKEYRKLLAGLEGKTVLIFKNRYQVHEYLRRL